MERELKQLRSRVRQLEGGGESQRELAELLEASDDDKCRTGGGFAAACAEAEAETTTRQLEEARGEVKADPACVSSRGDKTHL
jgi:hypothetical protein